MPLKNMGELCSNNLRKKALDALNTALVSLTPRSAVAEQIKTLLKDLDLNGNIKVFGFGKAAESMYSGLRDVMGDSIEKSFLIVPEDEEFKSEFPELTLLRGTHPFPSELTLESSMKLLEELKKCGSEDQIIFLISGGGSSLFEIPVKGISIKEMAEITRSIMDNGASIDELNRIRISLSSVKGGKLLNHLKQNRIFAFYISDVFTNDLHFLASGPLIPYKQEEADLETFRKFEKFLKGHDLKETTEKQSSQIKVANRIVLSNEDFVTFIERKLPADRGVLNLGHTLHGEVETLAKKILSSLRNEEARGRNDFWFVGAGESTVNVKGDGKGGRNQELCLRVLRNIKPEEKILFVSAGTDGIDGNSPAMGGIVDSETLQDSGTNEMEEYLYRNDSFTFLSEHNGALISGRTGNNVSDVILGHYEVSRTKYQVKR